MVIWGLVLFPRWGGFGSRFWGGGERGEVLDEAVGFVFAWN